MRTNLHHYIEIIHRPWNRLTAEADNAERDAVIADECNRLEARYGRERIAELFFKNFGCINFTTAAFGWKLNLARELHRRDMKRHPELHAVREEVPYSCYHLTVCKCGFSEAYDSGD